MEDNEKTQFGQDLLTCFKSDAGERVLEYLEKSFHFQTSYVKGGDAMGMAFKEGQRYFYLYLVSSLEEAENPEYYEENDAELEG